MPLKSFFTFETTVPFIDVAEEKVVKIYVER